MHTAENSSGQPATTSNVAAGETPQTLTTRQGHPVTNNQNLRTVGDRGPATLENYHFLEKISHFDRERVPERVVHARGTGAHGVFEAYGTVGEEPIARYTRAKLFDTAGKQTPVFVRFSSVIHGGHSPETLRDPRGFAVKFYTEDGNWDLVGNNLKVFFIRDAMKFPDLVHAFKPDPVTNRQSGHRIFDFISNTQEALHMISFLFSPWGIPANYRQMQGSGVNTYKWVNQAGEAHLVKYHWEPLQGVKNLTQNEAKAIQAENFNHATQDLYDHIAAGQFPEWELRVQLMPDGYHEELSFDPLDDTKLWPEEQFPHLLVGKMTLNRNPENYFAEVEQVAFGTGVLVDGLEFSDDKMLQGRTFSYSDTQRYRVGANYLQLPINAPKKHVATNQRDGQMAYHVDAAPGQNLHVNYEPSNLNGLLEASPAGAEHTPHYEARLVRQTLARTNDFEQPGDRYRQHTDVEKNDLIANLVDALTGAAPIVQQKMVDLFAQCDTDWGRRVAQGLAAVAGSPAIAGNGLTNAGATAVAEAEASAIAAKPY
jgi:catalase